MFSGGTTPHQHHAADLGKILLQAQADLRQIRESIADSKGGGGGAGSSSGVDARLQRVVEKVETELRLKAEAVLNTVVHGSASTLPMLGAHNFSTSQPLETTEPAPTHAALLQRKKPPPPALRHTRSAGDSRADAIARPAAAAVAASRHRAALRNPNAALSRQHIADRYGVTAPTKHEASRPAGKAATGKLRTERVSGSLGVPPAAVRADPQAVAPIGPKDVAAGLYSLVTRGLIPPNVDLTPAMARKPAPLAQAPARVHDYKSQFASHHSSAYISPFGFNVANTKLDLISDVGTTLAERRLQSLPPPPAAGRPPIALDIEPAAEPPRASPPLGPPAGGGFRDESAREFDELMDTFSLHHFIIRHGVTLDTTPEYASFQRKYAADWGALQQLISRLEALMATYDVPLAYVDGAKLAALALDPLETHDERSLLRCLVNADQVIACMEVPGQRYHGRRDADSTAAVQLQAGGRGMLARKQSERLRRHHGAALLITRRGKVYALSAIARRRMAAKAAKAQEQFTALSEKLKVEWPRMRDAPRVIIHLCSLSASAAQRATIRDLEVKQNAQLPRLCDVRLPNTDVVYVAPFPLNEDITHYFSKVLEIGGVAEPQKRYKIVIPENHHRFPSSLSLTTLLLYSPRALRRIQNFCVGKYAYIVPSHVGPEELKLATALNIPLLAPSPAESATYGTKSGAKRVFAAAQVNTPPSLFDIYDEDAIVGALTRLICTHLDVPRWILKLDDEFGGRGHAHLDVASLPCYQQLLRTHDTNPHGWEEPHVQSDLQAAFAAELRPLLAEHVVLNCRWLWRSWREYAAAFARSGGVIEASPLQISSSPSVNLAIAPDGAITIGSAHEQIFSSTYTFIGAAFPQTAVPYPALREASLAIGRACYERGVVGHVGVDFVSFFDADGQIRIWAVDLNLRLTPTAVSFTFFDFLVGGVFDPATGRYLTAARGAGAAAAAAEAGAATVVPQRSYVMNEMLYHPQLASIHHSAFFNQCRLRGVSFDLEERTGTVFNLMDSFVGGVLGILTVGTSLLDALRKFADCLDFMQKQVGPANASKPAGLSPEVSFREVIKAIKAIVDAHLGERGPPAHPPPLPAQTAPPPAASPEPEPLLPGIAGQALLPPPKRYLQQGQPPE